MARDYQNLRTRALRYLLDKTANLGAGQQQIDKLISDAVRLVGNMGTGVIYGMLSDEALAVTAPSSNESKYDNSFAGRICTYMESQGYLLDKNPGEVTIVYVEGCDADGTPNEDKPNEFNDRRLVIRFESGNPQIVGNWEATSEPGFYYTDNPMNVAGAARIKFGQYRNAWQVGTHGNSAPHEALVQVGNVTVFRDYNRDMSRIGDKEDTGLFGINQHAGYDYPYGNINQASAGCLVGRTWVGHEEFMKVVKSDPRYKSDPHGFAFSATIIPGDKLAKK